MDVEYTTQVWLNLESHYISKSLTSKLHLKVAWAQDDGGYKSTHQCAQSSSMTKKAMILLYSLPSSYNHLATTLMQDKQTLELEEVTLALLAYDQRKLHTGKRSQSEVLQGLWKKERYGWFFKGNTKLKSRNQNKKMSSATSAIKWVTLRRTV